MCKNNESFLCCVMQCVQVAKITSVYCIDICLSKIVLYSTNPYDATIYTRKFGKLVYVHIPVQIHREKKILVNLCVRMCFELIRTSNSSHFFYFSKIFLSSFFLYPLPPCVYSELFYPLDLKKSCYFWCY